MLFIPFISSLFPAFREDENKLIIIFYIYQCIPK